MDDTFPKWQGDLFLTEVIMDIKLSTGKVAFPIEFDNGDVETIYFNPNDPDLVERLNGIGKRVQEKLENLKDIELDERGEPVSESVIDVYTALKNALYEEIDRAFDSDVCEKVFKHCSPLAIVDGNYFILNFLEAIAPEIKTYIEKANKDVEKKMQKHIGKYQKKK